MNKPDKSSIFKTSLLVVLLGSVLGAQAAGLGKLTVYSAIGQPLNAEVALSASAEELGGISAKLASHEAFRDAGVQFMPALTGLRMNVAKSAAGQPVLQLTTDAPLNEPFLHFLVELNWTAGRMVREYTFLLDPPEMLQAAKPASIVTPAAPEVRALDPVVPASQPVAPVAVPRAAAPIRDSGKVHVKAGDTLSKIARENKPETVSLDQMLVALFNGNREAFIGDNMNRLRAGKILKLPDEGAIRQVDHDEARRMIVSQAVDFNAYRRRLADAAAVMPAAAESQQSAAGRIKPQIEQKAPPAPIADKLEVSRTEAANPPDGGERKWIEEELIARDKALREASERIAQLEKNLDGLKRLAELKSQSGAEAQQQAQAVAPAPAVPAQKTPEVSSTKPAAKPAPKPVSKPASPPPSPEPDFIAENPELVFGGGGLIALLLGYLGFSAWRRKKQSVAQAMPLQKAPGFHVEAAAPKAAEESGIAKSHETADDVSILGDFSQGALTTEESADPVAEADVLMAYGRDGQAEEILLEGLKSDPTRGAIHVKLLELYANRKDAEKFEKVARDLHTLNNGRGSEWERAGTLARDLGVTGMLFAALETGVQEPAPAVEAVVAEEIVEEVAEEAAEAAAVPADEPSAESAVAELEVPPAVAGDEPASLDFDLDLGTTSMPAVAIARAEAAQDKPAEEVMSLDFDFDLGTPSDSEPPPQAEEVEKAILSTAGDALSEEQAVVDGTADGSGIDFSLDIDETPGESAAAAIEAPVEPTDNEVDFDLGLDTDSAGETAVEAVAAEPATVPDLEPAGVKADILDLDLGMDETSPVVEAAAVPATGESMMADLGLADISLDLDIPEAEHAGPMASAEAAAEADLPESEAPMTEANVEEVRPDSGGGDLAPEAAPAAAASVAEEADDPEVATKLELAQAYEEMGDREGARELLSEVLNEGSAAQQSLARARLDQLDF